MPAPSGCPLPPASCLACDTGVQSCVPITFLPPVRVGKDPELPTARCLPPEPRPCSESPPIGTQGGTVDLQGCRPRGGRSPAPSFSSLGLTPDTVPLTVLSAIPEDRRGAPGPGPCAQEGPTLHSVLFCRCPGIPDFWMRGPRVFILYQALQTRQPVLPRRNGESSRLFFFFIFFFLLLWRLQMS